MEENTRPGSGEPGSRGAGECVGEDQGGCGRPVQGAGRHQHHRRGHAAGIAAITSAGAGGVYTVNAPAPAAVGGEFTPANLDNYRAVVFLNTGIASPLTDAQRANFEAYFKKGGGFVGIGSADRDRPELAVPHRHPRHALLEPDRRRSRGTVKVFDRVHDATKNLPEYWDRTDNWYNFTTNVRGRVARPRDGRRGSVRPPAQRPHARRHRRRHDGRQPPDLLVQGLPGRPLVLHRPRHHRRAASTRRLTDAPQGRDQLGRRPEPTRPTATAARPCSRTTSRPRSAARRT